MANTEDSNPPPPPPPKDQDADSAQVNKRGRSQNVHHSALYELQQPAKLSQILKNDVDDCRACRWTGSAAFLGLGAYIFYSGNQQLRERGPEILKSGSRFGLKGRMVSLTALSSTFAVMGVYRFMN